MEDLTIGQRIAAKRKELGLSQIELGERMGVSRQSVSKWEADAAIPEIDKLIALSKLFSVSVGWLLGVEAGEAPEEDPEQTFTDREWEIIDRLTQEKPGLPRWLLPLAAGAAAVSLIAALLSGAALYAANSRKAELAAISQSVADLAAGMGVGLREESLLHFSTFQAQPSPDLNECAFHFLGIPVDHEPEATAELFIVLDGEEVLRQECQWDGSYYTTDFTLPVRNGYTASFCLAGNDGIVRTCQVYDRLLCNLQDNQSFGNISVKWDSHRFVNGSLIFENMRFEIDAPEIFRNTPDLWAKCDLVALGDDGRELGRTDILNRSPYSKAANFAEADVSFFTREQTVSIGGLEGIDQVELMLECKLANGMDLQKCIRVFDCDLWR